MHDDRIELILKTANKEIQQFQQLDIDSRERRSSEFIIRALNYYLTVYYVEFQILMDGVRTEQFNDEIFSYWFLNIIKNHLDFAYAINISRHYNVRCCDQDLFSSLMYDIKLKFKVIIYHSFGMEC